MVAVWILIAQMTGDFSMTPFTTEAACRNAIDGLVVGIVTEADCHAVEMIMPAGSRYAPEMAPLPRPKPKPGRDA